MRAEKLFMDVFFLSTHQVFFLSIRNPYFVNSSVFVVLIRHSCFSVEKTRTPMFTGQCFHWDKISLVFSVKKSSVHRTKNSLGQNKDNQTKKKPSLLTKKRKNSEQSSQRKEEIGDDAMETVAALNLGEAERHDAPPNRVSASIWAPCKGCSVHGETRRHPFVK